MLKMSNVEDNIKFDSVFDAIEHYKSERDRLEDTLKQHREKRLKLQDTLAVAMAEQTNCARLREKSAETLKMVQHKLLQVQAQANALREAAECKQQDIRLLQDKIMAEKNKQIDKADVFDSQLESLCVELKSLDVTYSTTKMNESLRELKLQQVKLESKLLDAANGLKNCEDVLERLTLDKELMNHRWQSLDIPGDSQQEIQQMLSIHIGKREEYLQELATLESQLIAEPDCSCEV